jgi:tRNA-dihydrouridine synthase B
VSRNSELGDAGRRSLVRYFKVRDGVRPAAIYDMVLRRVERPRFGLVLGRAAFGRPWIFREIEHFLATGETLAPPAPVEIEAVVREHLEGLYALYGEAQGLRVARKHLGWYTRALPEGERFRQTVVRLEAAATQRTAVNDYFARLAA